MVRREAKESENFMYQKSTRSLSEVKSAVLSVFKLLPTLFVHLIGDFLFKYKIGKLSKPRYIYIIVSRFQGILRV